MFIPVTQSRAAPSVIHNTELEEDMALHVDMVYAALPTTSEQLSKLAAETAQDSILKKAEFKRRGGRRSHVSSIIKEIKLIDYYYILLKRDRIVVPTSMHREMLTKIHKGHLGAEKSKRRAHKVLHWPSKNSDIDQLVSECAMCQEHYYKQTKEPLITTELPTDIFHDESIC